MTTLKINKKDDLRTVLHFEAVDYECKVSVNGKPVGEGRVEETIPGRYGMNTFDIGMDLNAAVFRGGIYKTPNKFTGTIDSVTIELKK